MTINDNYPIYGEWAKNTDKMSCLPIVHYSTVTVTISQSSTAWQREEVNQLNQCQLPPIRSNQLPSKGVREHTHKKNCLNLGIARKGGRGLQACPNCLEHFLIKQSKLELSCSSLAWLFTQQTPRLVWPLGPNEDWPHQLFSTEV